MLYFFYKKQRYRTIPLKIGNKKFTAIVADSFIKKMIGLMFRDSIKPGQCMLFIFGSDGYHGIWMKDMRFPIDVLWLDDKKRIVGKAENLSPRRSVLDCETSRPERPARYVLEFNAGFLKKNNTLLAKKVNFNYIARL